MFRNCSSLISLNLINWDFTNVDNLSQFLTGTTSLISVAEFDIFHIISIQNEYGSPIHEIEPGQTIKIVLEGISPGEAKYSIHPFYESESSYTITPTEETIDSTTLISTFTMPEDLNRVAYKIKVTRNKGNYRQIQIPKKNPKISLSSFIT